jgi:PadR family transcriptional regulator
MEYSKNVEKTLKQWDKEYKKGFTSYVILLFLKDQTLYGYEIKSKLEDLTNHAISYQDSGIYQILKKLNSKKFVTSELKESNKGPKRKYYSITQDGLQLIERYTMSYILPINKVLNDLIKINYSEV